MSGEPRAGRPHMPGYGVPGTGQGEGLLPWSWAEERLSRAHTYLVVTTRPDGAPHLMPVWGIWLDAAFTFSTGGESRKARNLAADQRCVVSPGDGREAVVVEGRAQRVSDPGHASRISSAYEQKYGMAPPDATDNPLFTVRPLVVFGLIEDETRFAATATRWTFDN